MNSNILCIESATDILSVAIFAGADPVCIQESTERFAHAARITQLIHDCCREASLSLSELTAVAVSNGPGSYTSLRVGLSTAKGIAYALDKPLITLDTLHIAAAGARHLANTTDSLLFPMIDARRMEVYGAHYTAELTEIQAPEAMIMDEHSLDALLEHYSTIILCGNGSTKLTDLYTDPRIVFGPDQNSALYMGPLALMAWKKQAFADVAYTEPFYLKAPNITTPRKIL